MVEGAGLENLYTRKGIVGSNPTLSARTKNLTFKWGFMFCCFNKKDSKGASWEASWRSFPCAAPRCPSRSEGESHSLRQNKAAHSC